MEKTEDSFAMLRGGMPMHVLDQTRTVGDWFQRAPLPAERVMWNEFNGIPEQVGKNLREQGGVAQDFGSGRSS
jgi:hypothetical protein